jgi:Arc/MetJ-type ribon-helix-helix transcriptional regulator
MARQKATYYLAEDIRTATKVAAVATHKSESDVVEEALRRYLRSDESEKARDVLRALMDRVAQRIDSDPSLHITDDEAMAIADEAKHAVRNKQGRQR